MRSGMVVVRKKGGRKRTTQINPPPRSHDLKRASHPACSGYLGQSMWITGQKTKGTKNLHRYSYTPLLYHGPVRRYMQNRTNRPRINQVLFKGCGGRRNISFGIQMERKQSRYNTFKGLSASNEPKAMISGRQRPKIFNLQYGGNAEQAHHAFATSHFNRPSTSPGYTRCRACQKRRRTTCRYFCYER